MKKNIYIEFLGLAGSGKSTISKLLIKEMEKRGYDILDWDRDTVENFLSLSKFKRHFLPFFYIKNYHLLKILSLHIFGRPKKIFQKKYIKSIKRILVLNYLIKIKKVNIIINQEGPLKDLICLHNDGYFISHIIKDNSIIKNNFLKIYIFLSTKDNNLLIERIRKDAFNYKKRMSLLSINNRNKMLTKYKNKQKHLNNNIKMVKKIINETHNTHFLQLNANECAKKNTNIILDYLKEYE